MCIPLCVDAQLCVIYNAHLCTQLIKVCISESRDPNPSSPSLFSVCLLFDQAEDCQQLSLGGGGGTGGAPQGGWGSKVDLDFDD